MWDTTRSISCWVKLSKEDLKELIKEQIKNEGFVVDKENISFDITSVWRGYGQDEHEVTEFAGCTITCEGHSKEKQFTSRN